LPLLPQLPKLQSSGRLCLLKEPHGIGLRVQVLPAGVVPTETRVALISTSVRLLVSLTYMYRSVCFSLAKVSGIL
jgi:hypothetical protein